jgi:F-type H+-transporting ATPase subunit epsilon
MKQDAFPKHLQLRVLTRIRLLVDAEADEVSLPSLDGYLGVLPGHRNCLVGLGRGRLSYRRGSQNESFRIHGGYAEIFPDRVTVFTDQATDDSEDNDSV